MPGLFPALLLGLVLGVRHATDADHVVAVTTIVTRRRSLGDALRIGALWGAGHSLTILLVGGAIVALDVVIPGRLALAMEFAVALMLIGLGGWNLFRAAQPAPTPISAARPVLVGVVHGLAGSAAIALLVVTTIRDPWWSLAYLVVFGLGTVGGMIATTATLAAPMIAAARRVRGLDRSLQYASGALSVFMGLALAAQLTLVEGLFA